MILHVGAFHSFECVKNDIAALRIMLLVQGWSAIKLDPDQSPVQQQESRMSRKISCASLATGNLA
jgi:hypothetical protein